MGGPGPFGMIPVGLEPGPEGTVLVQWEDLGSYHCYNGFFDDGLAMLQALVKGHLPGMRTPLADLPAFPPEQCVSPTGLIFHSARCGSTLLAKVLARSRKNIVVGEADVHNTFWRLVEGRGAGETELFRRLVVAMGLKRLPGYDGHIVKFTSHNVMRFRPIREAFPQTPALFLFRDPQATLDSYHRGLPGWMGKDCGDGLRWHTPEAAVEDFWEAAMAVREPGLRMLDYSNLTPASLPSILEWFGQKPDSTELRQMLAEFGWNSKSRVPKPFVREVRARLGTVSPRLAELYTALRAREAADWPELSSNAERKST